MKARFFKLQIFSEGHKILKKVSQFFRNLVAFLEYLNINIHSINRPQIVDQCYF